jgi:hypothetical protein
MVELHNGMTQRLSTTPVIANHVTEHHFVEVCPHQRPPFDFDFIFMRELSRGRPFGLSTLCTHNRAICHHPTVDLTAFLCLSNELLPSSEFNLPKHAPHLPLASWYRRWDVRIVVSAVGCSHRGVAVGCSHRGVGGGMR